MERALHIFTWFEKLPLSATPEERIIQFSQLVARAYALLAWFEGDGIRAQFWSWKDDKKQLRSLELQAILYKILLQNTREKLTDSQGQTPSREGIPQEQKANAITDYEKIPRKDRPTDRIENSHDPDVRTGNKSSTKRFTGDKCQHDGQALEMLVDRTIEIHDIKPLELTGDSHYGSISNRLAMQVKNIELRAPLPKTSNPTGLLPSDMFTYDEAICSVTCPAGNCTTTRHRTNQFGGFRFTFNVSVCKS